MLKIIFNLTFNRATKKQWQLEIGAYLLKKGCGYEIGQIIREKKQGYNRFRVKVITGLFYDFSTNKINHTKENRIISEKDVLKK